MYFVKLLLACVITLMPVGAISGELPPVNSAAPYPPLVTDIPVSQKTIRHSMAPRGASAGASGFPAAPSGALGGTGTMTSIVVLGILAGVLSLVASDGSSGSTGVSATPSTN